MRTRTDHEKRLGSLAEAARHSRQLADDDRQTRDDAIEDADVDGVSVRAIARAAEMHPGQVSKICAQRTAERQAAS